jgi:hypothetical protein
MRGFLRTIWVHKGKDVKVVFVQECLCDIVSSLVSINELLCDVFNDLKTLAVSEKCVSRFTDWSSDPFAGMHSTVVNDGGLSRAICSPKMDSE